MIARAWRAWVALWDRREPPTSLALARVFVAATVLADLLVVRAYGLVDVVWRPPSAGGIGWGGEGPDAPLAIRWFGAADAAGLLWTAGVAFATMFLVGALTRVSGLGLLVVLAQLAKIAPESDRGIDVLLRVAIGVLMLSGSHAVASVDAWAWARARLGRPMPALVPAWPRYLLFAQLVWVYFSAGQHKTHGGWTPFEGLSALYVNLCDPHFARFTPGWMEPLYPLTQVATLATWLFEWLAPVLILATWYEATRDRPGRLRRWLVRARFRWIWIAVGVSFHLGIAVTMRLGIFPFGVLALYPVLFHPDELRRAFEAVRARVGLRRA